MLILGGLSVKVFEDRLSWDSRLIDFVKCNCFVIDDFKILFFENNLFRIIS